MPLDMQQSMACRQEELLLAARRTCCQLPSLRFFKSSCRSMTELEHASWHQTRRNEATLTVCSATCFLLLSGAQIAPPSLLLVPLLCPCTSLQHEALCNAAAWDLAAKLAHQPNKA